MYYKIITVGDSFAIAQIALKGEPLFDPGVKENFQHPWSTARDIFLKLGGDRKSEEERKERLAGFLKKAVFIDREELEFSAYLYWYHQEQSEQSLRDRREIVRNVLGRYFEKVENDAVNWAEDYLFCVPTSSLELVVYTSLFKSEYFYQALSPLYDAKEAQVESIIRALTTEPKIEEVLMRMRDFFVNYVPHKNLERVVRDYAVYFKNNVPRSGPQLTKFTPQVDQLLDELDRHTTAAGLVELANLFARLSTVPNDAFDEELANSKIIGQRTFKATYHAALKDIHDAISQDVPLGSVGLKNRQLLAEMNAAWTKILQDFRKSSRKIKNDESPKNRSRRDAYIAWSIEEWITYIEGAKPKSSATKQESAGSKARPDKAEKEERKKEKEESDDRDATKTPEPAASEAATISEAERQEQAKTYLEFVRQELNAVKEAIAEDQALQGRDILKTVDNALNAVASAIRSNKTTTEDLRRASLEAQSALDAFGRAQTQIQKAQHFEKFQTEFNAALNAAVANEKAVYGRRQGGKLSLRCPREYWPSVYESYHGQPIDQHVEISLEGQPRFLNADESLRYYVTLSSQSTDGFCISAHIWRGDYDTYVPCFVLHVPWQSKQTAQKNNQRRKKKKGK